MAESTTDARLTLYGNYPGSGNAGRPVSNISFRLDNGYTVSMALSVFSYSELADADDDTYSLSTPFSSVEVAVLGRNGEFVTSQFMKTDDDVAGYVDVGRIPAIMFEVSKRR